VRFRKPKLSDIFGERTSSQKRCLSNALNTSSTTAATKASNNKPATIATMCRIRSLAIGFVTSQPSIIRREHFFDDGSHQSVQQQARDDRNNVPNPLPCHWFRHLPTPNYSAESLSDTELYYSAKAVLREVDAKALN
jgi:hypothetical protein